MSEPRDPQAVLRRELARSAGPVRADENFTEQLIAAARQQGPTAAARAWRNWTLPVAAAVLVGLLLGSVLVGTKLLHSRPSTPAAQLTPRPSLTGPSRTAGSPTTAATSPPASAPQTLPAAPVGPVGGPVPVGFTGYDLTWISVDDGWVLGTAPCADAPCTSILRTRDGGRSWVGVPAPRAFLRQTDPCPSQCHQVSGIRFVSPLIGYVYGPNSFYRTVDGGQSWQLDPGNAFGLERSGASVLRVSGAQPDCAPGCRFVVQRAALGSPTWIDVTLPQATQSAGASLSVNGSNVVLATYGNPAGGANNAQSVVFTSTDGGSSWQVLGEPCPQVGGEVDTTSASVGGDGSIALLCRPRAGSSATTFLATSIDHGQSFAAAPAGPGSAAGVLIAVSSRDVLAGGDRLYRWDGSSWAGVTGPGGLRFAGFENSRVGRVLADNGLWTTADGGRSWRQLSF